MKDRLVLAKGHSFSTDSRETGLNNNVAVIGCTGSGKTCSVVIPRLLNTFETNLVLTDPKRELFEKFAPLFRSRGYNVLELNLDTPADSDICFDPFCYTETSDDISRIAETVSNSKGIISINDQFWQQCTRLLVELLMRYTLQFKNKPSFADFLHLARTVEEVESSSSSVAKLSIAPVLDSFEAANPLHPLSGCYRNMHEIAGKTLASVLISMRSLLADVFSPALEQMFREKPSFDIDRFISEKTVLFITADGSEESTNTYVNMVYETLMQYLMKKAKEFPDGMLPIPVHIIMDDFACGARINSFPQMITTFRSKGISSTIILQDESQLGALYGADKAKTILNNNDTLVYLGGNDVKTAEDISVRMNVPLDDVLYMSVDSLVFFRRGQRPVKAKRYPLFEDPDYIALSKGELPFTDTEPDLM